MAELRVAALRGEDLPAVVAIHERAFPDSAITVFGGEAIRRYYAWLLEGPHDAALMGAWRELRLVGFCAGGVFRGAMNGFLRRHRWYLALEIARHPRLLASALVRDRLVTAAKITLRFSRLRRPVPTSARPSFGILSLATDPDARGGGVGRALMVEAEARARSHGFERMVLTVHPENEGAIRFYERIGWTRRVEPGERWDGVMQKLLTR